MNRDELAKPGGETFRGIMKRIRLATLRIQFAQRRWYRNLRRILHANRKLNQ